MYTLRKLPDTNVQENPNRPKRTDREEAVVVKADGISYAELLKTVKEKVDTKNLGINIDGVRKTKAGDLLIVTKKGTGEAKKLRATIERETGNEASTLKRSTVAFHLRVLDAATDELEIFKTLELAGVRKDNCQITSIRPTQNETRIATIKVFKEAKKLLGK